MSNIADLLAEIPTASQARLAEILSSTQDRTTILAALYQFGYFTTDSMNSYRDTGILSTASVGKLSLTTRLKMLEYFKASYGYSSEYSLIKVLSATDKACMVYILSVARWVSMLSPHLTKVLLEKYPEMIDDDLIAALGYPESLLLPGYLQKSDRLLKAIKSRIITYYSYMDPYLSSEEKMDLVQAMPAIASHFNPKAFYVTPSEWKHFQRIVSDLNPFGLARWISSIKFHQKFDVKSSEVCTSWYQTWQTATPSGRELMVSIAPPEMRIGSQYSYYTLTSNIQAVLSSSDPVAYYLDTDMDLYTSMCLVWLLPAQDFCRLLTHTSTMPKSVVAYFVASALLRLEAEKLDMDTHILSECTHPDLKVWVTKHHPDIAALLRMGWGEYVLMHRVSDMYCSEIYDTFEDCVCDTYTLSDLKRAIAPYVYQNDHEISASDYDVLTPDRICQIRHWTSDTVAVAALRKDFAELSDSIISNCYYSDLQFFLPYCSYMSLEGYANFRKRSFLMNPLMDSLLFNTYTDISYRDAFDTKMNPLRYLEYAYKWGYKVDYYKFYMIPVDPDSVPLPVLEYLFSRGLSSLTNTLSIAKLAEQDLQAYPSIARFLMGVCERDGDVKGMLNLIQNTTHFDLSSYMVDRSKWHLLDALDVSRFSKETVYRRTLNYYIHRPQLLDVVKIPESVYTSIRARKYLLPCLDNDEAIQVLKSSYKMTRIGDPEFVQEVIERIEADTVFALSVRDWLLSTDVQLRYKEFTRDVRPIVFAIDDASLLAKFSKSQRFKANGTVYDYYSSLTGQDKIDFVQSLSQKAMVKLLMKGVDAIVGLKSPMSRQCSIGSTDPVAMSEFIGILNQSSMSITHRNALDYLVDRATPQDIESWLMGDLIKVFDMLHTPPNAQKAMINPVSETEYQAVAQPFIDNWEGAGRGIKPKILGIYKVVSPVSEAWVKKSDNVKTLYHGTSYTVGGIITETHFKVMRTASNGRAFGDGIYFSDVGSKVAQYIRGDCSTSYGVKGIVFVCDVDLGKMCDLGDSALRGYSTSWNSKGYDSVCWPRMSNGYGGRDPEYVVADVKRIKIQYIIHLERVSTY